MNLSRKKSVQFAVSCAAASALALSLVGCSQSEGSPGSSSTESAAWGDSSVRDESSLSGTVFDPQEVHSIEVTYDEAEYEAMLATYKSTEDKEWISATVTIDGKTFKNIGLRLKGNSSLRSVSTDTAGEEIPWLIRLDKFTKGQHLDGYTDFVIRSNSSDTALNEAVAQSIFAEAGLASQAAIAVRFSVNGSDEVLRLAVENPNDDWDASQFDTTGILYKAEANGDYTYRGDSAEDYTDVFDQETNSDSENYAPLAEFLKFINESDDETFAAELKDHLDVTAFASYLALQDLIDNFDDIDGPGNNSYLRWSSEDEIFTVVNWDLNLAFGGSPGGMGGGMGGGPGGSGGGNAGEQGDATGTAPEGFDPENLPEGFDPDNMPERPAGTGGQQDGATNSRGGEGGGFGGMSQSNVLKDRFLEVTEFSDLYAQAKTELTQTLYTSGKAQEILDQWTATLTEQASDLVTTEQITSDADSISKYFTASTSSAGSSAAGSNSAGNRAPENAPNGSTDKAADESTNGATDAN